MSKKRYVIVVSSSGAEVEVPIELKEQFLKNGYKLKKGVKDGK